MKDEFCDRVTNYLEKIEQQRREKKEDERSEREASEPPFLKLFAFLCGLHVCTLIYRVVSELMPEVKKLYNL